MFLERKIIAILLMFGFLFLGSNIMQVQAQAQPDNFPIGLYVVYTADSQIPPGEENIYTIRYDFREWVNQDTLLIEYEKEDVTYVEHLGEIYLDGYEHPPIWLDVSLFQTQSVFTFSGCHYHYVGVETHWVPGLEEDCFRIEYSIIDSGMENWSMLYYHCETGIIVDYTHAAFYEDYSLRELYMNEILGTNLDEFNPLTITMPESTQTTTTTSSSTTSTTTTTYQGQTSLPPYPTTRSTTSDFAPPTGLSVIFGFGIIVEIIIIILIVNSKNPEK